MHHAILLTRVAVTEGVCLFFLPRSVPLVLRLSPQGNPYCFFLLLLSVFVSLKPHLCRNNSSRFHSPWSPQLCLQAPYILADDLIPTLLKGSAHLSWDHSSPQGLCDLPVTCFQVSISHPQGNIWQCQYNLPLTWFLCLCDVMIFSFLFNLPHPLNQPRFFLPPRLPNHRLL